VQREGWSEPLTIVPGPGGPDPGLTVTGKSGITIFVGPCLRHRNNPRFFLRFAQTMTVPLARRAMSLTNAALVGNFLTSYYKLGASESFLTGRFPSKKRPLALAHRLHTIEKL
jgi:hypothetical protein